MKFGRSPCTDHPGIGGGGIIVAVLMFCGDMAPHDAVRAHVVAEPSLQPQVNELFQISSGEWLSSVQIILEVPMSKAVVFMGVVVSSFMNVKKRGPQGGTLCNSKAC